MKTAIIVSSFLFAGAVLLYEAMIGNWLLALYVMALYCFSRIAGGWLKKHSDRDIRLLFSDFPRIFKVVTVSRPEGRLLVLMFRLPAKKTNPTDQPPVSAAKPLIPSSRKP